MYKVNGFDASFFTRRHGVSSFLETLKPSRKASQRIVGITRTVVEQSVLRLYKRDLERRLLFQPSRLRWFFHPRSLSSCPLRMSCRFPFCSAVHKMSPFFFFSTHRQYLNNCSSHGEHEQNSSWEHMTLTHNLLRFVSLRAVLVSVPFFYFLFSASQI